MRWDGKVCFILLWNVLTCLPPFSLPSQPPKEIFLFRLPLSPTEVVLSK